MNIFKSLIELFTGWHNFVVQMGLFALSGIASIAFVNVITLFFGNSLYSVFISPNNSHASIFAIIGFMIAIFFIGYQYKLAKDVLNNNDIKLPTISLDCFVIFSKVFVMFIPWSIYLFILHSAGVLLFGIPSLGEFLIFWLVIFLIPFIQMILIIFSKDFIYQIDLFKPLILLKLIKKTFFPILIVLLQFIILFIVMSIGVLYLYKYCAQVQIKYYKMQYILLATAFAWYLQTILNLTYFKTLAKIVNKYYFDDKFIDL